MLRGVPVIASNIGGIPEAKMGVDYLLPVRPIEKYGSQLDEQMVPPAEVPAQDVLPWETALARLVSDREHYEDVARTSRAAALAYAEGLDVRRFEALLEEVVRARVAAGGERPHASPLDRLSPERRKLLALRLRKPARLPEGGTRLLCFPHAGGSAAAFREWAEQLPREVTLIAMRARRAAKPRSMAELVDVMADAMTPYLDEPFAFFGHSMGAIVAFELARLLRRRKLPMPSLLIASGARAPRFRLGHVPSPEPSEEKFIEELRRLEGTPRAVLDDPKLLCVVLPALREDAGIYRQYIYSEQAPLDCPIRAYGGAEDANVTREHLEAWASETTASFSARVLPGGHFYLQTSRDLFFEALGQDLGVIGHTH